MKQMCSLLVLILTGCSFIAPYKQPAQELPVSWAQPLQAPLTPDWWRRFRDPTLDRLIEEALQHNKDLDAAISRVLQAQARAGRAWGELAPAPSLAGAAGESWASTRMAGSPPKGHEKSSSHAIMLGALWELDFWGKFRNAVASADAALLATEANLAAARLLVAGTTAKTYFALLGYTFQVNTAEQTLTQRLQALEFYRINESVGFISQADRLRAESEVETARYSLAMAQLGLDETQSALLVLIGRSPAAILGASVIPGAKLEDFPPIPLLPNGLPSNLLLRRPDLRVAEENLRAAHFDVGVVRADYFPSLSLTGQSGLAGEHPGDLFRSGALNWNYGLNLRLPLDFWNTRFRELMAQARCREAAANYDKAVQAAFGDIRNALSRQSRLAEAESALKRRVEELKIAVIKAEDRYQHGYSNFLDVLDANRTLFDARLNWAQTRTRQLHATVDMCMALGGGWDETTKHVALQHSETPVERGRP